MLEVWSAPCFSFPMVTSGFIVHLPGKSMVRKPKAFAAQLSVVGLLVLAAVVGLAFWHASNVLRSAQKGLQAEREVRFVARPLAPPINNGFEPVSSPAVFSQIARFENNLYV